MSFDHYSLFMISKGMIYSLVISFEKCLLDFKSVPERLQILLN